MGKDRSSEEKEDNLKFRVKYSVLNVKYMTIKLQGLGSGMLQEVLLIWGLRRDSKRLDILCPALRKITCFSPHRKY